MALGACWLNRNDVASLVQNAPLHFDDERYRLLAWCRMPNHLHAVVEWLQGNRPGSVLHSWKSFTANRANATIGRTGPFRHDDYFDRHMRDESYLEQTIDCVELNPVKAKLIGAPQDRPWSSARFR
jgi:putative transposase